MCNAALASLFVLTSFQDVAEGLASHLQTIRLLSFAIAAITALMMWLAWRHIKSEKWMWYFAWFFFLLAALYLWPILYWLPEHLTHPEVQTPPKVFISTGVSQLLSVINNLFALAAANDIQDKRPLIPRRWRGVAFASFVTVVAASAAEAGAFNSFLPYDKHHLFYQLLGRSVDSLFSAYCLSKVGFAIIANIGLRRRFWVAFAAFGTALFYAAIHIIWGLSPSLGRWFFEPVEGKTEVELFDAVLVMIALLLKLFLAAFSYLLVVRFFETLYELRMLQRNIIEKRQDYLSTYGVVQLIGKKLGVGERGGGGGRSDGLTGFVNLTVRLPGEDNKRVACILWPTNSPEPLRAEVFDWNREKNEFSSVTYKGYDEIPRELYLKKVFPFLPYVGRVLRREKELIHPKLSPQSHPGEEPYEENIRGMVNIAIQAHGAAIGCLQVVRFEAPFSQMAIRQVREIASLISPAVQAYRELAGLDQMSISFTVKQASADPYSPKKATEEIVGVIQGIFAPTCTYAEVNFGFCTEAPFARAAQGLGYVTLDLKKVVEDARRAARAALEREHVVQDLEAEIDKRAWKLLPEVFTDSKKVKRRLLKKRFTARVTETLSTKPPDYPVDRFTAGSLLIAVGEDGDNYAQPALGTTYLHRKTASTLAADAYLDFARDYYSGLLKKLGTELSEKRLNIGEWFKPIEEILTKEAKLAWVVVGQRGRKGKVGSRDGLCVLKDIRQLRRERRPILSGKLRIGTHHRLKSPHFGANHVLTLTLPNAEGKMWLGVERPGFGPELEFSSPWKTFLDDLVQIADASLTRISFPEKFRPQLEAAQVQGIVASIATAALVSHQFRNLIESQSVSIRGLLRAVEFGQLKPDDERLRMLHTMKDATVRMREIFQYFDRVVKMDEHRPCRLADAARHASKLYELSILQKKISCEIDVAESIFVDVPFNVAALALANVVGNAKDAVSEEKGRIRIEAVLEGESVLCSVIDNGKGVLPEQRKSIFDPKESTKKYGGGIGLYLTKHSLSENGSSIVLSKSDETGSVFTIRFPLSKEVAAV